MRIAIAASTILIALAALPPARAGGGASPPAPSPDYADPGAWLARPPDAAPEAVDVFFIHPTTFLSMEPGNARFDEAGRPERALQRGVLRYQASVFSACCRLFAPRYRQASLGSFLEDAAASTAALDLAYRDVERAFDRFLQADSRGRPFILAGHSQGSVHLIRLLQQRVIGTPLQARLVAAYAIGASLPAQIESLGLPVCDAPRQTGCVIVWNSVHRSEPDPHRQQRAFVWWSGRYEAIGGRPLVCVNPLDWRRDGRASADANRGAMPAQSGEALPQPVPGLTGAECRDGLLQVDIPFGRRAGFRDPLTLGGIYHDFDYNLFYVNLRDNAAERAAAWRSAR